MKVRAGKKFEDLTIADGFMFAATMVQNKLMCQKLIQMLLENPKIEAIDYIEVEKQEKHSYESKGVRFDVYVKGHSGVAYVVEMQTVDTKELCKRARYYQSMADIGQLKKGEKYKDLRDSYVIFICREDVFGHEQYKYSFENRCSEIEGLKLRDGTYKVFFNTAGKYGNVSHDVKAFLKFVEGAKSDSSFIKELNEQVEQIKKDEKWQVAYMQSLLRDQDMIDKGIDMSKMKIAKHMLADDFPFFSVSKYTGLSAPELENLSKEVNETHEAQSL